MRRLIFLGVFVAACSGSTLAVATPEATTGAQQRYVVLYEKTASPAAARAAINAAGGEVLRANTRVGVATVVSANPNFLGTAVSSAAIKGVARNKAIGEAPKPKPRFSVEMLRDLRDAKKGANRKGPADKVGRGGNGVEPLAPLQWDMKMMHATADGSYAKERGSKDVLVGIIDTGIDGNHPDIESNFSRSLSRNFTTDIPLIDGPCADEPDNSCSDPADVDENSHGTHVASTIGSPINNLGMAGVAPEVTLVNLRAGQDSGFFFVQPSVDALTYAGDHGIDVVNMSYFIDPWLFNCRNNPADSPAAQMEQRTIIEATQRALDYAHDAWRHPDRRGRERELQSRPGDLGRDQPGLSPGHGVLPHDRQQLPQHARAGQQRDRVSRSGRRRRRPTTRTTALARSPSPPQAGTSAMTPWTCR